MEPINKDATLTKTDGTTYALGANQVNTGTIDNPKIQGAPSPNQLIVTSRKAENDYGVNSNLLDKTLATISTGVSPTALTDGKTDQKKIKQAEKDVEDVNKATFKDPYTGVLDSLMIQSNDSTKNLIGSIQANRLQQGAKINESFDRYKRGMQLLGIQSNMAQATPELFLGSVFQAEQQNLEKLQNLDREEKVAIMEAENARTDKNLRLMTEKMNYVKDLRREKATALKELHDAQRQDLSDSIALSETVAPFVYDALEQAQTDEEKEEILTAIAQKYGMPLDVLLSQVSTIKSTKEKEAYEKKTKEEETAYKRSQDAINNAQQDRQLNISQQNANKSSGSGGGTSGMNAAEKKQYGLQLLDSAFSGGINPQTGKKDMTEDGTPYVDDNGYITPAGFKDALREAKISYGVSRKDVIDTFGDKIYIQSASEYGLTPAEIKSLGGANNLYSPAEEEDGDW